MYTAAVSSAFFGAGMPGFCFFFGGMIDGLGDLEGAAGPEAFKT
jgi:hypothetical protein